MLGSSLRLFHFPLDCSLKSLLMVMLYAHCVQASVDFLNPVAFLIRVVRADAVALEVVLLVLHAERLPAGGA